MLSRRLLHALVWACGITSPLAAQKLFMTPVAAGQPATACNIQPFACPGTSANVPPSSITSRNLPAAFANTAGTLYFIVSPAKTGGVAVTDNSGAVLQSFDFQEFPAQAALTPDGSKLLVAAGQLHVFDVGPNGITGEVVVDVGGSTAGNAAVDVGVSPDSKRAYVLNRTTLLAVDLASKTVSADQVTGFTGGASVTVAPNGLVYVGADDSLLEVDPASMTVRATITAPETRPGRLAFNADASAAYAPNLVPFVPDSTGGYPGAMVIVDLVNRQLIPALGGISSADKVVFVDNNRIYVFFSQSQSVLQVTKNGQVSDFSFPSVAGKPISAMAWSDELPAPRYLFFATQAGVNSTAIYRVDTTSDADVQAVTVSRQAGQLLYAAAPSEGPVTTLLPYRLGGTVPLGGSFTVSVRALDASGRPVANAPVNFTAANMSIPVSRVLTNGAGFAQTTVTAPEVEGSYQVVAQASASATATFNITVGAGTTPGGDGGSGGSGGGGGQVPAGIAIVAGQGQVLFTAASTIAGFEGTTYQPLTVVVKDQNGQPVPNATVTWQVSSTGGVGLSGILINAIGTPSGAGGGQTITNQTDTNGQSGVHFTTPFFGNYLSYQTSTITATWNGQSVTFYETAIPTDQGPNVQPALPQVTVQSPAPTESFTAASGQTIPGAVKVKVTALSGPKLGQGIPNAGVSVKSFNTDPAQGPVVSCVGGTVLTSGSSDPNLGFDPNAGVATCDLVVSGRPGTTTFTIAVGGYFQSYPFPITVTPGAPSKVVKTAGDNLSGDPGKTVILRARVTDASDNPLSGVQATWQVLSGGVKLDKTTSTSNGEGEVSVIATYGTTPGPSQIKVTAGQGSATFTLTSNVVVSAFTAVSGNNQSATVNNPFANPLVVQVTDAQGRGVAGVTVTFEAQDSRATANPLTATTDAQGQAKTVVTAGPTAGPIVVTARSTGLQPVTFNLTSRLPGPVFTTNDVVNAASNQPGVVPGGLVTIYATGIAPDLKGCVTPQNPTGPFPTELAGVKVDFDWTNHAPILAVCNTNGKEQVNVQAPFELAPGDITVTITANGVSTNVGQVKAYAAQPGIFESNGLAAVHADGTAVTPSNPAHRGEILKFYATGLGPVLPLAKTNEPGKPGMTAWFHINVGVNNAGVPVAYAEYAPNLIGLYLVTFAVPADAPAGTVPLGLGVVPDLTKPQVVGNSATITIAQ